jgi:hypothetical protein
MKIQQKLSHMGAGALGAVEISRLTIILKTAKKGKLIFLLNKKIQSLKDRKKMFFTYHLFC